MSIFGWIMDYWFYAAICFFSFFFFTLYFLPLVNNSLGILIKNNLWFKQGDEAKKYFKNWKDIKADLCWPNQTDSLTPCTQHTSVWEGAGKARFQKRDWVWTYNGNNQSNNYRCDAKMYFQEEKLLEPPIVNVVRIYPAHLR